MLSNLVFNLRAGGRLVFFRRVHRDEFIFDLTQAVVLYLIVSGVELVVTVIQAALESELSASTWISYGLGFIFIVVAAVAIAALQGKTTSAIDFLAVLSATSIVIYAALLVWAIVVLLCVLAGSFSYSLLSYFSEGMSIVLLILAGLLALAVFLPGLFLLVWAPVVLFRSVKCVFEVGEGRALLLFLIFMAVGVGPGLLYEYVL